MARFVEEIIEDKIVVSRKKKAVLVDELRAQKYRPFPKVDNAKNAKNTDEDMDQEEVEDEDEDVKVPGAGDYDYLLTVSSQCSCGIYPRNFANFGDRCKYLLLRKNVLSA